MKKEYYYVVAGKRSGPVSFEILLQLATKTELKRRDKVWCQGMKEWQPAESVAKLFDELPPDLESDATSEVPPPLPVHASPGRSGKQALWAMIRTPIPDPAVRGFMRNEREIFIIVYPIGVVLALLASHYGDDASTTESSSGFSVVAYALLAVGAFILAYVHWMKIHHRLWKLIPPAFAATSPGKAVGFYFIPLFNVYWAFVTFNALASNANRTLVALGRNDVKCNEGLALAFSITQALFLSGVLGVVPVLALLAIIASYVLWILWYSDLAKAFIVIERHAALKGQPSTANLQPIPPAC